MKIELKMRLKESSHNILKLYWYTADDEVILETRPWFKLRLPKDTYVIFLLICSIQSFKNAKNLSWEYGLVLISWSGGLGLHKHIIFPKEVAKKRK